MENNLDNLKNLPSFYIGQKVVCVDDSSGKYDGKKELTLNKVYTIIDVDVNYMPHGVRVSEIKSNPNEMLFSTRFKPLEQKSLPLITLSKVIKKEKHLI
jgi:hypothetical protein